MNVPFMGGGGGFPLIWVPIELGSVRLKKAHAPNLLWNTIFFPYKMLRSMVIHI